MTPRPASSGKRRPRSSKKPSRIGISIATAKLPRHGAFYIALVVGVLVAVGSFFLAREFAVLFGAIAMFATYLVLIALILPVLTADFLRSRADEADTPTGVIFLVVVGVVAACSVSLFMALNSKGGPLVVEVMLSISSVLLGWFVIHTMAALHYAYEYYKSEAVSPKGDPKTGVVGGLDFPEDEPPDWLSFLYFSYVIGVAFAVSDIRITSAKMRKIVLVHATFSYFFNTLIVAATVNVAVAVGGS